MIHINPGYNDDFSSYDSYEEFDQWAEVKEALDQEDYPEAVNLIIEVLDSDETWDHPEKIGLASDDFQGILARFFTNSRSNFDNLIPKLQQHVQFECGDHHFLLILHENDGKSSGFLEWTELSQFTYSDGLIVVQSFPSDLYHINYGSGLDYKTEGYLELARLHPDHADACLELAEAHFQDKIIEHSSDDEYHFKLIFILGQIAAFHEEKCDLPALERMTNMINNTVQDVETKNRYLNFLQEFSVEVEYE
ncbi:MAG: hypothetical protein AAGG81_02390 [Chlamydiota bacterium]